jgi:hypothetical protein
MKVRTKPRSGSVKIDPEVLRDIKAVCVRDDINIKDFINDTLKVAVKKLR